MKWSKRDIPEQHGRTVLVTGANSGIGFETAKALAERGARVILACRSPERGEKALKSIREAAPEAELELRRLDLSDLASVETFSSELTRDHDALHLLVNNAGVMIPPESRTKDGFELQIGTNHFGHFALTARLLPLLLETERARLVVVASTAHRWGAMNFDDLNWRKRRYRAWRAYGQSKLANLLFARELSRRVRKAGRSLLVASSHPGYTATNLTKHSLPIRLINPYVGMPNWRGALPSLYAATADDVQPDDYFGPDGPFEIRGWPTRVGRTKAAQRAEDAEALWEMSERETGTTPGATLAE